MQVAAGRRRENAEEVALTVGDPHLVHGASVPSTEFLGLGKVIAPWPATDTTRPHEATAAKRIIEAAWQRRQRQRRQSFCSMSRRERSI